MPTTYEGSFGAPQGRFALVAARFNSEIVDQLIEGALDGLRRHGIVDDAIDLVKKRAKIPAGEAVTVVAYPPRRSILDLLFRRSQQDAVEAKLAAAFLGMPFRAWMRGGMLRMMPYWISVK